MRNSATASMPIDPRIAAQPMTGGMAPGMAPIIVQTTLIVGIAIIIEAALSFLGFGVRPPIPTWGGMAASGAGVAVRGFWWELVFSASALIATVLAVNYIGDGLRDALDPTQTIERK